MPRLSDQMRRDFARFQQQAEANLRAGAAFLQAETRKSLNRPYPPASRPGESPARRTGRLQAGQFARVGARGTIQLFNTTRYAAPLRRTRPWDALTLERVEGQLGEILTVRGYQEALNGR
jgi:hypothetical protein